MSPSHPSDRYWLAELCASRGGFAMISTVYSAVIPLLVVDWKMTAGQAGLVQSGYHAGQLVSLFVVGFLSDRYGAKRVFLLGGFAASASSLAFALFANGFVSALVLHFLAGLFAGASYTPGLALITDRYAAARGRAMGFFLSAASIGYALALVLAGGLSPLIGWRGALVVVCSAPVLATLVSFHALRHTPNVIHPKPAAVAQAGPVRAVLANRPAMLSIWAYAFHNWELMGLKAWMPAYLAAAAAATGTSALRAASLGAVLTAITYVASALGGLAGGALSDRLGRTRTILVMAFASLACSFGFGWLLGLPLWLVVLAASLYVFTAIGDSAVYSTSITELVDKPLIGAAYSVRSVLGFGIAAVAPWAVGTVFDLARGSAGLQDWAWGLAWSCLALGALPGPIATLLLRRRPEARRLAGGLG